MTRRLDRIDFEIIAALQKDARTSNQELAARVGLAPSTCHGRVRRLVDDGVIRGFHADVDPEVLGVGLQAVVAVQMKIQTNESFLAVSQHLAAMPEVLGFYNVAGSDDFLVHLAVRDPVHLQQAVVRGMSTRDEVGHVETSLVFEHYRAFDLPNYTEEGPET